MREKLIKYDKSHNEKRKKECTHNEIYDGGYNDGLEPTQV